MAFLQIQELDWHKGELAMQDAMHVPHNDNPTVPTLSPQLANHLQIAPLIAVGVLDTSGRPWTTLWGGEPSLGAPVAKGIIGLRAPVTPRYDPVIEELYGFDADGTVIREEGKGRMVSGLTIDLETRKRVKFFGRMVAGALSNNDKVEAQLVLRVEQSLGNCPKYLNKQKIIPAEAKPRLIDDSPQLSQEAISLINKSDLFFVSSITDDDMDTNHRGGPVGFMRVVSDTELVWPEYSGNRLYQTLGNLKVNPLAGICIPEFETGDMLYMTGTTEILIGADATDLLPRCNLVVKLKIAEARYVAQALPYRGVSGELSPYNPVVRFLAAEKKQIVQSKDKIEATLLTQTKLTPTISRYKFALSQPAKYKSGQYVTFDFSSLLDIGYSHMRNDDPRSLNDDYVRTFTVSSSPDRAISGLKDNEFEITIRHVGVVTNYMARHLGTEQTDRQRLDVDTKGFGGDFEVTQDETICFIAAGVGITPLLPALPTADLEHLNVLWAVREADLGLVHDLLSRHPALAKRMLLFITDSKEPDSELLKKGVQLFARRMNEEDIKGHATARTYICTSVTMRQQISQWLPDKQLVFEDFNF